MVSFTMSDKSVVDQIRHYQRDITKCPDNAKRMIRCIERLMVLPVTIGHLQETGVGRSVNELRKCGGEVGAAANSLVCKWKSMVQAEEDSDPESEVEDNEPKEAVQVPSPDLKNSPSYKTEPVDKHKKISNSEEHKKPKSDHGSKKSEPSQSDNRLKNSDRKNSDKPDHKSYRSKSSKSEHGSGSDSKHSSSYRPKSEHDSKSHKKFHSSHRSESEFNGDIKTEKTSSKTKPDESKSSKSSSSESRNKDIKQKYDKDKKHRREDSSHKSEKENRRREESSHRSSSSSNSKKYDVKKIESESSDDDTVYKPRSKKRKKSDSEDDRKHHSDKYSGRSKHKESKRQESSDDSDARNSSEEEKEEESSQASSRYAESQHESENEEEMSNRSSPNNISDNEVETDDRRNSSGDDENEDSHSEEASDSEENCASPEREIYVPTKIKKEKESPPRHSKSSRDISKSSSSKSSHSSNHNSSNHSSTHNSSTHSKNDKASSIKKEDHFENIKIKKEKDKDNSKKQREERSSDKKSHKSSNSHSDSINKSNKTEKKVKIKIEKEADGSIDCESGASFADALMGLSVPKKGSAKRKSTTSTPEKPSKSAEKPADGRSKSHSKPESRTTSSSKIDFNEPDLLSKNIKLEPLDVDLKSTLPEISPHYKPLPHYSPPGSPAGKRTKLISQEEALSTIMSTKNQRTKVYSGNKTGYLKVPSLFDLCIQVLRDNIEALEYTGGVPYDLLKPVLDRATASQLFQLEHYNPYLVEDTDGLWKFHCNKDFRGKEPDEFETWRELYVRLLDERERKLEALKANITQSMAKNTPVRQTKLAYVDSVVKPPRNIARKQMKFGTGKAVKHDLVSKAMVGAASSSPAPAAVPVPAPPASARSSSSQSNNAFPIPGFLKKKKAPLMQKTLQLIKGNRFKR